jgi:hypothetical protein
VSAQLLGLDISGGPDLEQYNLYKTHSEINFVLHIKILINKGTACESGRLAERYFTGQLDSCSQDHVEIRLRLAPHV